MQTPFIWASKDSVAHQLVRQHHRERLIADRFAGASDRMAESSGLVLVDDGRPPIRADAADAVRQFDPALRLERRDDRRVRLEVGLDAWLEPAGDDHDVIDAGPERLVDHELQQRRIADGKQLLRKSFGGGQEPGTEPGRRDHRATNNHGHLTPEWTTAPREDRLIIPHRSSVSACGHDIDGRRRYLSKFDADLRVQVREDG